MANRVIEVSGLYFYLLTVPDSCGIFRKKIEGKKYTEKWKFFPGETVVIRSADDVALAKLHPLQIDIRERVMEVVECRIYQPRKNEVGQVIKSGVEVYLESEGIDNALPGITGSTPERKLHRAYLEYCKFNVDSTMTEQQFRQCPFQAIELRPRYPN